MEKTEIKSEGNTKNIRHGIVARKIVENRGNVSKAMKEAGYSAAYSKNPHQLMKTKSFAELLDDVGLTDEVIAQDIRDLKKLGVHREKDFFAHETKTKRKTGRGYERSYRPIPDSHIKKYIDSIPGAKLVFITNYGHKKTAFFTSPDHQSVKAGIELATKTKGLIAPEKHEHEIHHDLSEEERGIVGEIFKGNK